jgi:hypothetical protein
MDRLSRQKTLDLNNTLDQIDATDILQDRTFYPNAAEEALSSSTLGIPSRTQHILGHKVNRFKKI